MNRPFKREEDMIKRLFTRRTALAGAVGGFAVLAAVALAPLGHAADKPAVKFSAVFAETDIRAEAMRKFGEAVSEHLAFQPYFAATLVAQGTELTAMQRGNLEMAIVAPQDVANQIPAWSLLTAAYLFRDAEHLKTFFKSDAGQEMVGAAEEQLGIHILGPVYFGTRQVNLGPDRKVETPADLAGMKLRMPGGDAWQFLGKALGANPVPLAYAEVYTALQTGAIDGQDNPLPNDYNMKFYEVTSQIVLTSHLVGYDLLAISKKVWDGLSAEQQAAVQAAADDAIGWSTEQHLAREQELVEFFRGEGLKVYKPNVDAFREHAQKLYLESDLAKDWPEGMLDRINAL